MNSFEKRPGILPNAEFVGHNFEDLGPEKIANYFVAEVSRGSSEENLRSVLKKFGDDVELRFLATQNFKLLVGNELHDSLIESNGAKGDKYIMGVFKPYKKARPVKMLSVPSEIAQFFKAKSENPADYQTALDIISKKVIDFVETLRSK